MPKLALTRHLTALGAAACLFLGLGASAAKAATAGLVPPRNPASDCSAGSGTGVGAIDACRAQEGIGPLVLPNNWGALTSVQKGFVLIDLERVNRGLPAIVGLSAALNGLASSGAANGTDPPFPTGGFVGGGGIWAGAYSVFQSDYMWMYLDGPGGDNLDCAAAGDAGCWGHRDIILWDRTPGQLVSGGGFVTAGGTDSLAYLVLSGYSTADLTFTWTGELEHFASRPGLEPLGKTARARHHKKSKHHSHRHRHRRRHAGSVSASSSSSSSSNESSASGSGPSITIG